MQSTLAVLCPFTPRLSPHVDLVQRWSLHWATRHGLLDRPGARAAFARARFANLMARAYPDAAAADLQLATAWLISVFALDDRLERAPATRPRPGASSTRSWRCSTTSTRPRADTARAGLAGARRGVAPHRAAGQPRLAGAVRRPRPATISRRPSGRPATGPRTGRRRGRIPHDAVPHRRHRHVLRPHRADARRRAARGGLRRPRLRRDAPLRRDDHRDLQRSGVVAEGGRAGDHHNIVLALRHERRLPVEAAVRAAVAEHDALVEDFVAARERFAAGPLAATRGRGGRRRLRALDPRQRRLVDGVRPVYAVGRHPRRRR